MQSDMPEVIGIKFTGWPDGGQLLTPCMPDDEEATPYARIPDGVNPEMHAEHLKLLGEAIVGIKKGRDTIAALKADLADAEALSAAVLTWHALDHQRQQLAKRNQQLDDARREMVRLAAGGGT